MPYQDEDEVLSAEPQRSPSRVEKILRKIFVEDWSLKLLSLAITLALWVVVTSQNTPVNTRASVQLQFIRPNSLDISNDPPRTVDVVLSGSKHKLDALNQANLVATVDLSDQRPGERVVRLADRAQLDLPEGVKIDAYQPGAISLRLEPIVVRQLNVEPMIEGKPAEGYEVYSVRPDKASISIQGPASVVNAFQKAPTESISVAGRKESFTVPDVAINISNPKISILDPVVTLSIEIGERAIDRSSSQNPIMRVASGELR
jgi:YbbR domain-containing protein